MHSIFRAVSLAALVLIATQAHASQPGWSCDGDLSFVSGAATSLSCSGSLSLTGVDLSATDSIRIQADQAINLYGTHLSAPLIDLVAGGSIWADSNSVIGVAGDSATLSAGNGIALGSPTSSAGATLQASGIVQISGQIIDVPVVEASSIPLQSNNVSVVTGGSLQLSPVPEPAAWLMLALGLGSTALLGRRKS